MIKGKARINRVPNLSGRCKDPEKKQFKTLMSLIKVLKQQGCHYRVGLLDCGKDCSHKETFAYKHKYLKGKCSDWNRANGFGCYFVTYHKGQEQ